MFEMDYGFVFVMVRWKGFLLMELGRVIGLWYLSDLMVVMVFGEIWCDIDRLIC